MVNRLIKLLQHSMCMFTCLLRSHLLPHPRVFIVTRPFSDHCITPARTWSHHCHCISLRDSAIFKKYIIGFTVLFQRNAKVGAVTCQVSLAGMIVPLPGAASKKTSNIRESFV